MKIHPTAEIHASTQVGCDVEVGAGAVIGPDVIINDETRLEPHVVIHKWTRIGKRCHIRTGAVLGGTPQDRKFSGERSYLVIGDDNEICEYVTIHRATGEDRSTVIGSNNLLMANCHIGHNCTIGSNLMMANMVGISGHVQIDDSVVIGGIVGVHQSVRVGKLAMIGGFSKVVQDIPPFMMADGRPCKVYGLNVVGLRRAGQDDRTRAGIKHAYTLLYRSGLNLAQALTAIEKEVEPSEERDCLLNFLNQARLGYSGRQNDPKRVRE
jgi:UDP-N-acetylglucosamine acyltransferase